MKQEDKSSSPQKLLTNRELEILQLIAEGYSSQQIATTLFISLHTVNFHRKNIRSKLAVNSVGEMIRYAYQHRLI